MRHFLLFAGYYYYPDGGFGDLISQEWGSDKELDDVLARMRGEGRRHDWWQICVIDTFGMRLLESGTKDDWSDDD